MVENFVDILKAFIQKNLLIDIVPVIDDAGAYTKNMHWRYTRFNIWLMLVMPRMILWIKIYEVRSNNE